jgi:hypothetical protein
MLNSRPQRLPGLYVQCELETELAGSRILQVVWLPADDERVKTGANITLVEEVPPPSNMGGPHHYEYQWKINRMFMTLRKEHIHPTWKVGTLQ